MSDRAKFSVPFIVNSHDTDKNGNVRPSIMLRYLHEASNLQFESTHPTLDELRYDLHKAFLLSRASMEIVRPLRAFEKIEAVTWAAGGKAASFYRCGEIFSEGETVARLFSLWALIDLDTRKLCRVRDVTLGIESLAEWPLEAPSHLRLPGEMVLSEAGERRIVNSDIDLNGHMNNTNYPDMLCDYIPGIENKRVKSFSIGYLHEAPLGEMLRVLHGAEGDRHYLRTLRSDGSVNAEAIVETEELPGIQNLKQEEPA